MAKKQKKKRKTSVAVTPPVAAKGTKSVATRTSSVRSVTSAEFNPDYTYVIKDLKRIGTLAGSFFVILIVLSFFLR